MLRSKNSKRKWKNYRESKTRTKSRKVFKQKTEHYMVPYSKQPYREKSRKIAPPPSSQAYTNLDTSSGGLTNYLSRTLHMVYPRISRAILAATL